MLHQALKLLSMIHLNFLDLELHPDGVHGVRAQGARHILTQQAGLPHPRVTEQNYLQSGHHKSFIHQKEDD